MTRHQCYDHSGHWASVICWSLGLGHWPFLNVVHLLHAAAAVDVLQELLEGHVVESGVRRLGELLVEQVDGDLAGGAVLRRLPVLDGQPAFEPADELPDANVARGPGEAVAALAADLALQEPA